MISRSIFVSVTFMATMTMPTIASKLEANVMEALDLNIMDYNFA